MEKPTVLVDEASFWILVAFTTLSNTINTVKLICAACQRFTNMEDTVYTPQINLVVHLLTTQITLFGCGSLHQSCQ